MRKRILLLGLTVVVCSLPLLAGCNSGEGGGKPPESAAQSGETNGAAAQPTAVPKGNRGGVQPPSPTGP